MAAPGEKVRPSATVILYREDPLRVYLVERNPALRFFPGFHAFPGGTLDAVEADREGLEAFRRAALRELFEETGVLLAAGGEPDAQLREETRAALLDGDSEAFDRMFETSPARADLESLTPAGRLLTPPFAPVRYDTQFFVARCPDDEEPEVRNGELVGGAWVEPREALERWERDAWPVPPPTLAYLRVLAATGRAEAAAETARATDGRRHHERFLIEFHPGVHVLPQRTPTLPPATTVNTYLLAGARDLYVVDPGTPHDEEREALAHTVDLLLEAGREPRAIVLTHHHSDHVASAAWLKDRYGFEVWAHEATAARVDGVDRFLADGDALDLPDRHGARRFRVLHTPGHTAGHLALLDERHRGLLTGDLVSAVSTILIEPPPEGDMGAYFRSLERCLDEDPRILFPAHGPLVPGNGLLHKTLEHRRERERKVLAALRPEARPVEDLVADAYADTPRELWSLAEESLLAHLHKLQEEGRAERDGDAWRAPA